MQQVLEYAQFTLKDGVTGDQLNAAAKMLQEGFLNAQAGYRRRELVRLADRTYADLIWWDSQAQADAAMRRAMESPACSAYFGIMELDPHDPNEAVKHYQVVATFG